MQSNLDRNLNLWQSEQLADIHVQDQTKQNFKKTVCICRSTNV